MYKMSSHIRPIEKIGKQNNFLLKSKKNHQGIIVIAI